MANISQWQALLPWPSVPAWAEIQVVFLGTSGVWGESGRDPGKSWHMGIGISREHGPHSHEDCGFDEGTWGMIHQNMGDDSSEHGGLFFLGRWRWSIIWMIPRKNADLMKGEFWNIWISSRDFIFFHHHPIGCVSEAMGQLATWRHCTTHTELYFSGENDDGMMDQDFEMPYFLCTAM